MDSKKEQEIVDKINLYAETALEGVDLSRTPMSVQLEKLRPVMDELSVQYKMSITDIFILYMDAASASIFNTPKDIDNFDYGDDDQDFLEYLKGRSEQQI